MTPAYSPKAGDIIWLSFNPKIGHEQSGRRPAVVLSPAEYNAKVGLALICPITNQVKGYPFEVLLPQNSPVTGVVLSDQVKSLDWRERRAEIICRIPEPSFREVLAKIKVLMFTKG